MRVAPLPRLHDRVVGVLLGLALSSVIATAHAPPVVLTLALGAWPQIGLASWYSATDAGMKEWTANGERFDDEAMTAAMWAVPFQACLQVTRLQNFRRIHVRINDRGPGLQLVMRGRILDLTHAAFAKLGDSDSGLIPVQVEVVDSQACGTTARPRGATPAGS